jgi:2-oxoisovalerate dehydrogenase E2 component (dihydrolipoyl transacylase)
MSFFVKSFSLALNSFPILNSTYNPDKPFEYITYDSHNITIAIDTPNGLAVPNIKNVQSLNILEIQDEINRLKKSS